MASCVSCGSDVSFFDFSRECAACIAQRQQRAQAEAVALEQSRLDAQRQAAEQEAVQEPCQSSDHRPERRFCAQSRQNWVLASVSWPARAQACSCSRLAANTSKNSPSSS